MKRLLKLNSVRLPVLLAALGAMLLAGCSIIPTYVPPGYEQPSASVPPPQYAGASDPGVAVSPAPAAPAAAVPALGGDVARGIDDIRVGDKLIITFSDINPPEIPFEATVAEDGMITLKFNKKIKAAGKKRSELEVGIRALYVPSIYKNLTVSIRAEDRFFVVGGEVRNPSRQIYTGTMTVLKCVAAAGGFTEFANKRRVDVTRANGQQDTVDCIRAQENPSRYDLQIYPGDQIHVHRRLF